MNGARFTAVLAGLAILLAVLAGLDVIAPRSQQESGLVAAEPARSGAWTCTIVDASASSPPHVSAIGAPSDGNAAAEVVLDLIGDGTVGRIQPLAPFPETATGRDLADPIADAGALLARWRRTPAVMARSWQRDASDGPGGTLAGPCVAASSERWVVPGVSTAGGAVASLALTNVFDVDASVSITLATPSGERAPVLLENVVVQRRSVLRIVLNEHAPEERDLGVVVTTRSGRVVVEAVQTFDAAIGGIDGVSLVAAAPEAAEVWTVPWLAGAPAAVSDDGDDGDVAGAGSDGQSGDDDTGDVGIDPTLVDLVGDVDLPGTPAGWLWITNPSDDRATVLVTLHTQTGALLTDILEIITLDPMQVTRLSLDGALPPGVEQVAVTVASENGVPVVVSAATTVASNDVDDTSLAVVAAVAAPAPVWVVPSEPLPGRSTYLAISNPSGADAMVDISLWTAEGILRPDALHGVGIPSGAMRVIELSSLVQADLVDSAAVVTATMGEVVVGHIGRALDGPLDLVVHPGVPSTVWSGGRLVSSTRFDPALANQTRRERD